VVSIAAGKQPTCALRKAPVLNALEQSTSAIITYAITLSTHGAGADRGAAAGAHRQQRDHAEPRRHPAEPPHSAIGSSHRVSEGEGGDQVAGGGNPTLRSRARARSPAIIKPSVPIAKEPRANQRSGFSDLGIETSHQETARLHSDDELCGCLNHVDSEFRRTNARDGSAVPRRITDPRACVGPVKCGIMFLDVVEIYGAERRQRLP
jgi:hypothetical protein